MGVHGDHRLATGSITTVGQMVHPRYGHTATLLPDGRVLIAGGDIGGGTISRTSCQIFDPETGSFRAIGPLDHHRLYHRATLLVDGGVLSHGWARRWLHHPSRSVDPGDRDLHRRRRHEAGESRSFDDPARQRSGADRRWEWDGCAGLHLRYGARLAELFDPATDAFPDAGALTTDRSQHAATLLADGRVLIAGGHNQDGPPSTTELFDPDTGPFVRGADSLDPLGNVTAALLRDGTVFVLGESGPPELFDPRPVVSPGQRLAPANAGLAGSVTTIDGPAVQRYAHTATLLSDGRVLVIGGHVDDGTRLDWRSCTTRKPVGGRQPVR